MSNPREAKKLGTDEYRELIADCIAEGILDYRDKLNGSSLPRKKKQPEKPAEESKTDEKKDDEKNDDDKKQDDEDSQEKSSSMPQKAGR